MSTTQEYLCVISDLTDECNELRAALAERDAKLAALEPFDDWPDYHSEAMGCGLEDRNITDRYEAMQYGWDKALDRVAERLEGYAAAGAVRSIPKGIRRKLLDELGAELECADGDEWDDAVVTMVENYLAAGAAPVPTGYRLVSVEALTKWRNAFAEELSAWDIDPPLHHVQTSHDEISAMLAAALKERA